MTLIKQINDFLGKDTRLTIRDNELKITIDNRTLIITLPIVVGVDSKAPSPKS